MADLSIATVKLLLTCHLTYTTKKKQEENNIHMFRSSIFSNFIACYFHQTVICCVHLEVFILVVLICIDLYSTHLGCVLCIIYDRVWSISLMSLVTYLLSWFYSTGSFFLFCDLFRYWIFFSTSDVIRQPFFFKKKSKTDFMFCTW